ncbi:MAG: OmpP1/FadL family transporter [Thermoanaerobaculia bacterium]
MKKPVLALAALLLVRVPAPAQVESALLSKVTFNLTNPGGKSLAMGGAFTAIADDATAGIANPAGLGLLSSFEAGVSGKRVDDVIGLATARSTATGGLFTDPYPAPRAVNSDISSRSSVGEFAGIVIPVSRRIVAAVSFVENLSFEGDPGPDGYSYIELRDNRMGDATRRDFLYEFREHGAVSLRNRLVALSAAYRVTDRLRLGAGVTLNQMELDLLGDEGGPHRIVNRTFTTPTQVRTLTTNMAIRGLDRNVLGFLVGAHVDLLADGKLTAGAVYRQTSKAEGTFELGGYVPVPLAGQQSRPFSARVPRDAAIGLAAQPFPGLTVAAEAQWIAYGDFIDRSLPTVSYAGFVGPAPGMFLEDLLAEMKPPDDVVVPRLGIEYVATSGDLLLAFRLGYHREPARGVTADLVAIEETTGTPFDVDDPPFSGSVRTVYDGGRPDDRFSGGLGATISRKVSFDLAFDLGRSSRVLSASLFYRF